MGMRCRKLRTSALPLSPLATFNILRTNQERIIALIKRREDTKNHQPSNRTVKYNFKNINLK